MKIKKLQKTPTPTPQVPQLQKFCLGCSKTLPHTKDFFYFCGQGQGQGQKQKTSLCKVCYKKRHIYYSAIKFSSNPHVRHTKTETQLPQLPINQTLWYSKNNELEFPKDFIKFATLDKRAWPHHVVFLQQKGFQVSYSDVVHWLEQNRSAIPLFLTEKQCKTCGQTFSHYWGSHTVLYQERAHQTLRTKNKNKNIKGLVFAKFFNRDYSALSGSSPHCIFCQYRRKPSRMPYNNFHPEFILQLSNFTMVMEDEMQPIQTQAITLISEVQQFMKVCEMHSFPVNLLKKTTER